MSVFGDAFAPRYIILRELGAGGMGLVFLARDTSLDRLVAIKVLRPELATAIAIERFSREARILARLDHPNIVRVYLADAAAGLHYYVMEYLAGETLKRRLEKGVLPPRAVRALGRALLDALGAAHEREIVHRDVKPDNVFMLGERTILADFGIAHADDAEALTETGQLIGTRKYMSPEQLAGLAATAKSDLYATGAVLYEACTGQRWSQSTPPEKGDWSAVPRSLARPLRKALALEQDDRWENAAAFRAALVDRPRRAVVLAGSLIGVVLVAAGIKQLIAGHHDPDPPVIPRATLAVVPFADGADGATGRQLARHVATQLVWFRRWDFVLSDTGAPRQGEKTRSRERAARLRAEGDVVARGADTVLQLVIRHGEQLEHSVEVPGSRGNMLAWGRAIADSIVRRTFAQYLDEFRHYAQRTSRNVPAHRALHEGQDAFRLDAWADAELAFRRALQLDPRFAQAAWSLALIRKWTRDSSHVLILRQLYAAQRDDLPPLQRLLTEAELAPDLNTRIALFSEAAARFPSSTDALLLLGNELYHRGPLIGIPLDSGIAVLEATAERETFSTARVHAALGHIRLGHREPAARQLRLLRGATPGDADTRMRADLLRFAFDERFVPWRGRVQREWLSLLPDAELVDGLYRYARLANFFDVPGTQLALGSILARHGRDVRVRASGLQAEGLALMLLGRSQEALPRLDSAAILMRSAEAEFQALEWRVLLPLLDLPAIGPAEAAAARARLANIAGPFAPRAAWALAADAWVHGDSLGLSTWRDSLMRRSASYPRAAPLALLLDALAAASQGSPETALTLTLPLLGYDPAGLGGDPFARAAVQLNRAEWQRRTGDSTAAERTLRFVEAWDTHEWPQREAQSGEVDVVASAVARLRRAEILAGTRRLTESCALARRVVQHWEQADAGYADLLRVARGLLKDCR